MKTQKHISRRILCSLMVVLCIITLASCRMFSSHTHEWGEWTVSKAPTCTAAGEKTRQCKGCGEEESLVIELVEHDWREATCTTPKTCANCGTTSGEALSHSYTQEVVKKEALKSAATCTKAAVYYKSCSCGDISKNDDDTFVSGATLSHTFDQEIVKSEALKSTATCTKAAVYYKSCSCGQISKKASDTFVWGDTLPHTFNQAIANDSTLKSAATCTKLAVYYLSCSCGHISTDENDTFESGDFLPHIFDQEIATDATLKSPATPTAAAVYYKSCSCGAISKDAKDTFSYGNPGDHTHSYISQVTEPTCSAYGYTTYTCSCGYSYKEMGTVLVEHTYEKNADPILYLAKDATCDEPALFYYSCSVCGACDDSEGAKTFADGEALGHYYVWKSNGDGTHIGICHNYDCQKTVIDICTGGTATCTQKAICEVCEEYYGEALGHNWKDGSILLAATCTVAGQKTQVCQTEGCGSTTTVTIPAIGHNYQSKVSDPTCTAKGYTTYTCQNCGRSYTGDYQAMLDHTYGEWIQTQAPTCTEAGARTHTCSCGASEVETVDAIGHNYTTATTAPTCTTQGYTTYTCQNSECNHSYQGDYVENSHDWNIEEPTCTEDQICSICGAKNEATGHSYALSDSTDATCTQAATKTHQCAYCEDSYVETVGTPIAHNIVGVTPTLVLVEGETCLFVEHYACVDCEADVVGEQVEKHNKYTATIQTAATCKTEGIKVLTCADCGETKTEAIPVDTTLGHAWVAGVIADGKRIDTCSACGTTKTVTVVVENQTNKTEDLKDTELSIGDVNINFGQAADSIGNQTQNDVTIGAGTLSEEEKKNIQLDAEKLAQIGDNPIYNFTVTDTENNMITHFGDDVYVTISIPYTLKDGEDIDSIAVWFISDTGEIEAIQATYNNGYVTFQTNHFSNYTVTDLTPSERCEVYGHNFKYSDPIDPTCTEEGYVLQYCIRCGYSEKLDVVAPIGHAYESKTIREATCTQEGLIRYTCSGCRKFYEERVPVLEHDYQIVSEVKATCTTVGVVTYKCSSCQYTKTTLTNPLGHDCKAIQVVDPTCKTKGYTIYACQNNGCRYSYHGDYQNVTEHTFGAWTVILQATCQTTGEERRDCTGCDRFETRVIPTTDHNYVSVVTDPTCDTAGYTTYTCEGCQNSYTDGHQDPIGHKYVGTWEWAEDNSSAQITIYCENEGCAYHTQPITETVVSECTVFDSTEKKEGRKEYAVHFEFDGESFSDVKSEVIPVKEHDHSNCEWQHNKFYHWYKCKYSQGNSGKVPHVFDEGTVTKEPTCQAEGTIVYKCVCGYEKTESIPRSDAHTGDQVYHDGEKHWNICTECNQKYDVTKHEWDDGTETKSATCTQKGTITYQCACGATKTSEIPALGHTEMMIPGFAATCTEDGLTDGKECSVCGEILVKQTIISCTGHHFEDGFCVDCGISEIPEHEHYFDHDCDADCNFTGCKFTREIEHVFDNDCDEICNTFGCGYMRKTEHVFDNACDTECNVWGCGYTRWIDHTYSHDCDTTCDICGVTREVYHTFDDICDPDCNNEACGFIRQVHEYVNGNCIYCGASEAGPHDHFFTDNCDITCNFEGCHFVREALHDFANDCDTECNSCGATRWVPDHNYVETDRVDETCSTDGYVTRTCSICGFEITETLFAPGHFFENFVTVKEATCTEDGASQGTCITCGETITEIIYAHGHDTIYEYVNLVDLGISCGGWGDRYICQICGEVDTFYVDDYYCSWTQTAYEEHDDTITYTYTCTSCGAVKKEIVSYDYSDTCNYVGTQTKEYYVAGELVWYGSSKWYSNSHEWSWVFEMQGTSCTDGYYVTEYCTKCDQVLNTYYRDYHETYLVEKYDFADYGACYGYLYIYECPCGTSTSRSCNYCGLNYVSKEYYTDDAGVKHTVETYACPNCGLTRVADTYRQKEGCYIYSYTTYTFTMGDTTIGSYQDKWQSDAHHEYEYVYTFDDETNKNCEAGVTITQTCRNCDYHWEDYRNSHNCDLVERYEFTDYGACYDVYIRFYSCPCGENNYMNTNLCNLIRVSETTFTDADGIEHTVYTDACDTCGLTRVSDYYYQREGCYTYRCYVDTFQMNGVDICVYNQKYTNEQHHVYEYAYAFDDETNKNCEAGVTVIETCRNCDIHNEYYYTGHQQNLVESYNLADFGACYGYIHIYSCPCGESNHTRTNWCNLSYVSETTYTDAQGIEHTMRTDACPTCGLTRVSDYYDQKEGCYTYRYYTYTFQMNGVDVCSYGQKSHYSTHHEYVYDYVFDDEANKDCKAGVTITATCRNCDDQYQNHYESHVSNVLFDLNKKYDCCDEHYIYVSGCPCGKQYQVNFDGYGFTFDEEKNLYTCENCDLTVAYSVTDQEHGCSLTETTSIVVKLANEELYRATKEKVYSNHDFEDIKVSINGDTTTVVSTCEKCGTKISTEIMEVELEEHEGEYYYDYYFTPDVSAFYTIKGMSNRDTYVTLYRVEGDELVRLNYNDDGAGNGQFLLTETLTAGTTYVYRIRFYTSTNSGTINYMLQQGELQDVLCRHNDNKDSTMLLEGSQTCEDGAIRTSVCRLCARVNYVQMENTHTQVLKERYDFEEYGACFGGYLYIYECACGEVYRTESYFYACNFNYVSQTTYTDAQGREHTVETYACSTCGLTRVRDFYSQIEGCYQYRYSIYTIQKDNTTIGSYREKMEMDSYHNYEYTYVFNDETNKNCNAGVTVTTTCRDCDVYWQEYRNWHAQDLVERYEFVLYGACRGYVRVYECPCGEFHYTGYNYCNLSSVSQTTYTDADGIEHTVYTEACAECGLTRIQDNFYRIEGCYGYSYSSTVFKMGDVVIYSEETSYQDNIEYHVYDHTYVFDNASNKNCEAGVTVITTCCKCDYRSEEHRTDHQEDRVERYEFVDYGACYGYLYIYKCPCGECSSYSTYFCDLSYVSETTYTDAQGIHHIVRTDACSTCGLTRVRDYYDQEEGCYTYRYSTYTIKMDDTTIGSYEAKSQINSHHKYTYTYVFDDEANRNCETGVRVTFTCRDCGYSSESYRHYHNSDLVTEYDLTAYGACYGYIRFYACPCGQNSHAERSYCSNTRVSETTYTDAQGRTHTVIVRECPTCRLTYVRDYYHQREGCYTYRYSTYTFQMGDTLICSYEEKSQYQEHHVYEYTYVFDDPTNRNCEAGVSVTQTCSNCDYRHEYYTNGHSSNLVQRYEFADYGACGGYLAFYECPCGEYKYANASRCTYFMHISRTTYTDAQGYEHTVDTEECVTCKLTYVRDYYNQREGCYTYRYNTYTFKMGDTVIGSYSEKSEYQEHHVYEYTYVFDDEANRNCEAGVQITQTCRNCDLYNQYHRTYHDTNLVLRYEFTEYGACRGYLAYYECPCGERRSTGVDHCSMSTISRETYVDGNGITHTIVISECPTCHLTRVRDYYDQREGCYTYRYSTYTFKMGNTVIGSYNEKSEQNSYHVFEYVYTFRDETNRNCEAGVTVVTTCRNCDYYSQGTYNWHISNLVERYEFADYGACGGYLRFYECPCGEVKSTSASYNCSLNRVSTTTHTDEQGHKHTVETYKCATCGLTRVSDYYDQREGCYTYRYYHCTVKLGNTVIGSYDERSQYTSHHDYVYDYVFDNEESKNCKDGVTVTQTCRNCDLYNSYHRTSHERDCIEKYQLSDYGADGGYVYVYECPCGYSTSLSVNSCTHGFNYTSDSYIDEFGNRWNVETQMSTNCDCNIRFDRAYYYTYDYENCTRTTHYIESISIGDRLVKYYDHTNTGEYHDYEVSVSLKPGATSCIDGVNAFYVCRNCDHSYTRDYNWHNTYEKERIDLAQYGSVCGGYISISGCACGYEGSWNFDFCNCGFDSRSSAHWIEGDIHTGQYTADGWNDFYTHSYIYTCFVTHPDKCGFVIRYSNYWKKNSDCSATQYITVQFGYDEKTDTYASEKTIAIRTRTYHNYVTSSIEGGTKYECSDCGSYYTQCSYYNANGEHIKSENIYVNTLNDGRAKRREEVWEYYRGGDDRWDGHMKYHQATTIYADGSEQWYRYDYTYDVYTAPFGENSYKQTELHTDSSGYAESREYAYTNYKGYQFCLYEHYTQNNSWYKYDYTYNFASGCMRTITYTDSNGENRTSTGEAHPTWYGETIKAPTCTQYGETAHRCPVCEEIRGTEIVKPTAHNWVLIPIADIYYCYDCGLQNLNGASGSIVMEDFTEKYGNGTAYVVGYWKRIPIAFSPYVTIYLHDTVVINGVPEKSFVLPLSDDQFHFVNDEYVGLYVNIADIEAAVAKLCQQYGVATFTPNMYDVSISFVPDGADGRFDYAITFSDLPGSEGIDYIIKEDEFIRDYIPTGGYKEYTVVSSETTEWTFESYANMDTYVHLFDADGNELIRDDDSAGNNGNFRLTYTLEAGKTYVVRVRWYSDQQSGYIPVSFDKK